MNEEGKNPIQNTVPSTDTQNGTTNEQDDVTKVPHVTETPQKAIRTYESDVAEVLAHKKVSTTTIALAEQKKATGQERIGESEPSQTATQNSRGQSVIKLLFILLGLMIIGGGIGAAYYFYSLSPLADTHAPVSQAPTPSSIVPADEQSIIDIDNMNPTQVIDTVRVEMKKQQQTDNIKQLILVKKQNGQIYRVSEPEMVKIMGLSMPDILVRSLSNNWMLGVYNDTNDHKHIFVIGTINYFQNAFAGMLQWESVMADDLRQYLYVNAPSDIAPAIPSSTATATNPLDVSMNMLASMFGASTTNSISGSEKATSTFTSTIKETAPSEQRVATSSNASTTENITLAKSTASSTSLGTTTEATANSQSYQSSYHSGVIRGSFSDRIVQNKDVREFNTENGVLFLYSFIDNTKLVVTDSESTLSTILNHLEQNTYIR